MIYKGKDTGLIIAIDFDGTITAKTAYPELGEPNMKVIKAIKNAKKQGARIVLWTNRQDNNPEVPNTLTEVVEFCKQNGVTFDAVNSNLPEVIEIFPNDTRKITADYYIDDKSPGSIEWFISTFGGDDNGN